MFPETRELAIAEQSERSTHAMWAGAAAYGRLLKLAEDSNSGQARRIARFIAACYDGDVFAFNLFELRGVDIAISDDMLACLDTIRWGGADLHVLVRDGDARTRAVIDMWGLRRPPND